MDIIISEDNKQFKRANKLKEKKYRDQSGEYLIEGVRGIADTPNEFIKVIFAVEGFSDERIDTQKVVFLSQKLMDKLSLTESSCGAIAIATKKPEVDFVSDYVLYLDRIRDP